MNIDKTENRESGVSLLEVMIATFIIGIGLVAYLGVFEKGLLSVHKLSKVTVASELAQDLLEEIKKKAWDEWNVSNGPGVVPPLARSAIGVDGGETANDKTTYDDLDDYNGHIENPPQGPGGITELYDGTGGRPNYAEFTRQVEVKYVNVPDGGGTITDSGGTSDFKKIKVMVSWNGLKQPVIIESVRGNY